MANVVELLMNVKSFAEEHFYLSSVDKEKFSLYLNNVYYYNGSIFSDSSKSYILTTKYSGGMLLTDVGKQIFFNTGQLTANNDENVSAGIGTLTIP